MSIIWWEIIEEYFLNKKNLYLKEYIAQKTSKKVTRNAYISLCSYDNCPIKEKKFVRKGFFTEVQAIKVLEILSEYETFDKKGIYLKEITKALYKGREHVNEYAELWTFLHYLYHEGYITFTGITERTYGQWRPIKTITDESLKFANQQLKNRLRDKQKTQTISLWDDTEQQLILEYASYFRKNVEIKNAKYGISDYNHMNYLIEQIEGINPTRDIEIEFDKEIQWKIYQKSGKREKNSILDALELNEYLVLQGSLGMGKTFLVEQWVLEQFKRFKQWTLIQSNSSLNLSHVQLQRKRKSVKIPFFIPLWRYGGRIQAFAKDPNNLIKLQNLLTDVIENSYPIELWKAVKQTWKNIVAKAIRNKWIIIFFDGLDEYLFPLNEGPWLLHQTNITKGDRFYGFLISGRPEATQAIYRNFHATEGEDKTWTYLRLFHLKDPDDIQKFLEDSQVYLSNIEINSLKIRFPKHYQTRLYLAALVKYYKDNEGFPEQLHQLYDYVTAIQFDWQFSKYLKTDFSDMLHKIQSPLKFEKNGHEIISFEPNYLYKCIIVICQRVSIETIKRYIEESEFEIANKPLELSQKDFNNIVKDIFNRDKERKKFIPFLEDIMSNTSFLLRCEKIPGGLIYKFHPFHMLEYFCARGILNPEKRYHQSSQEACKLILGNLIYPICQSVTELFIELYESQTSPKSDLWSKYFKKVLNSDLSSFDSLFKLFKSSKFLSSNLSKIPRHLKTSSGKIVGITLREMIDLNFKLFKDFKNLQELELYDSEISEPNLSPLKECTSLYSLRFQRSIKKLPENIGNISGLTKLDLKYNSILKLPEAIGRLSNLRTLDLGYNELESLPISIKHLTNLEQLYIVKNRLSSLPDSINCLISLKELVLSQNQLQFLPDSLFQLSNLEILDLGDNRLQQIPKAVGNLVNLRKLYLVKSEFDSLPNSFTRLINLQELSLYESQLKNLPEKIGNLKELTVLWLQGSRLDKLPESFCDLIKLERLWLSNNYLKRLPDSFGHLTNLQVLSLGNNQLKTIPKSFEELRNLKRLNLSGNRLKSIPEIFKQLKKLKELCLNENQLVELPKSIEQLSYLSRLDLENNQLDKLPLLIGKLDSLEELDLERNRLTSLPESFSNLKKLEWLFLNNNQLQSLPTSFGQLQNLKRIYLENNQLNMLPESIGQITSVLEIYLGFNNLTALPDSFGNLTNLRILDLEGNQLTTLPETFGQLTQLERLDLRGNPLTSLPSSFENLINLKKLYLGDERLKILPVIKKLHEHGCNIEIEQELPTFHSSSSPNSISDLTTIKYQNTTLISSEVAVLIELEQQIGKKIPKLPSIEWGYFGFTTTKEKYVIGLGLLHQGLITIPEYFHQLSNLELLDLGSNHLKFLSKLFGNLTKLKWLWLNNNRLRTLPESFGKLKSLQYLYLENNQLNTLPESIGHLTELSEMHLGFNQLNELPQTFGALKNLQWLSLAGNKLDLLPNSFFSLKNLKNLILEGNQLLLLPESFGHLKKLETLLLYRNHLKILPDSFGNLTNLRILDLEGNQLTTLPETFGQLTQLERLDLRGNPLTSLPSSFENFINLKKLYLGDERLKSDPTANKLRERGCKIV